MNLLTYKFLQKAKAAGIRRVAIETATKLIPRTLEFPFGVYGSVFSWPRNVEDNAGWPAIWGICKAISVDDGAGNTDQHQLKYGHGLEQGVYVLQKGKWRKK